MKKIFRKIHLWLSVPFGIFITLICFSGAMLVFEKEITELCRPDIYFVKEVKEKPLPIDNLLESVSATLPDSVTVTGVTVSPEAERTWQVSLSKPRRASLYVNPYTGEVTGRSERLPFYDTMFHLHRWMMGSSTGFGKLLVGVSTLMLVLILLTGILMWLTNKNKPLRKSLTISFTKGWPRFWHDLHVAGGIYATLFLLAIALTGLTWSFSWYRTGFYSLFGVEASAEGNSRHGGNRATADESVRGENARSERRGDRHDGVQAERGNADAESTENRSRHGRGGRGKRATADESVRGENARSERRGDRHDGVQAERGNADAESTENRSRHGRGGRGKHPEGDGTDRPARHHRQDSLRMSPFAHWQEVYEALAQSHPGYRQITLSGGSASVVPAGRNSLRAGDRFDFDTRSGRITGHTSYAEQDKSTHLRGAVYTVHVGSWGGLLTRIITFFAALLGATLPLTGYYLWIRRRHGKSRHQQHRAEA